MALYSTKYTEVIDGRSVTFEKDEHRVEAICWKDAEVKCSMLFPGNVVSGRLVCEVDFETGKVTDLENSN